MKEYEDERWREAADALGLELWSSRGKRVKNAAGNRSHEMRGTIDGFPIIARYGLQSAEDRITVIEVTLKRPLMLGFVYRVTAPLRDYRGRRIGAKHTDVLGVERDRVRRMVDDTESGVALARLADRYGDTGWLEIDDFKVRAHLEFYTDLSAGFGRLIVPAVQLATLVEAARAEIEPAPWETALAANLATAADALRLRLDERRFRLRGEVRGMATSLLLEASSEYALRARMKLLEPLPSGAEIAPRAGLWWKLAARLRLDRPSGDPAFDAAFQVKGGLRDCLSPGVTQALLELSGDGDVRVGPEAITFHSARLTVDAGQLLQRLAATADKLVGRRVGSPYRD